MWWSDGFGRALASTGPACTGAVQSRPQHDHLFHTVLGLLDVTTSLYDPALDLTRGCHPA